jgi:AcrR family transcriptional regulator
VPTAVKKRPAGAKRGKSGKGQLTALSILLAAGLTLGNLQYYYPSKDSLIKAMLDNCIQRYLDRFEQIRAQVGADPEKQFRAILSEIIRDLNSKSTTVFFPELWSLANHDDHAVDFMDAMYDRYRSVLVEVMGALNPELTPAQLRRLAVFISSSVEGHTMFIGYNKPWIGETDNIIEMAAESFLWLIRSGRVPA